MASLNKVQIIGRLTRDPELKYFPSGDAICNMTVVTSETWKDKDTGEKKELPEWHKVVMKRRLAEIAGQYLKKGSMVYLEGKLRTRKWQDKEGHEHYVTEIEVEEMKMLDKKEGGAAPSGAAPTPAAGRRSPATENPWNGQDDDLPY